MIERSYRLALTIILFTDQTAELEKKSVSFWIIIKQLIRAVTSVGANLTEGKASPSLKDFANFMNIALKSANETLFWLRLFCDILPKEYESKIFEFMNETDQISRILGKSLITMRKK